jgi:ligand-binding sensor domain-containing protein
MRQDEFVQPTTFRVVSVLTIVLLLAALVAVIALTVQSQPATLALPTRRPTATATAMPTRTVVAASVAAPAPTVTPTSTATSNAPQSPLPTAMRSQVAPRPTVQILLPTPSPTPLFNLATPQRVETDRRFVTGAAVDGATLWLATTGGALAWRAGGATPLHYTSLNGLPGNRLTAVAVCPLPGLGVVFGSDAGLVIYDSTTGGWRTMNPDNSGMRFTDVAALVCDEEQERLLIGYATHGIDIFDVAGDAWRRLDRSSGLGANDVQALAVDNTRNAIWVASSQGVTRAAGQDSVFYAMGEAPLTTAAVRAVAAAPSGMVWLGGDGVLYRINGDAWTRFASDTTSDGEFPNDAITSLTIAADGSIWLASSTGEICRFSAIQNRCIEFYREPPAGGAADFLTEPVLDSAQPLLVAGGNLYTVADDGEASRLTIASRLAGNEVRSLAADDDDVLWVTTEAGLQRFADRGRSALEAVAAPAAAPLDGWTLHPAPGGGMWLAGRGAAFFDGDAWVTYTTRDGLAGELVQAVATDSQGRTWFGTDSGLSIWNGDAFFNITAEQGLPAADMRALASAGDAMWIGSWGGGLYRFADNQLEVFNVENTGLPSDRITALAALPDGSLLLGTDRGLALFAEGAVTPAASITAPVTAIAVIDGVAWVATAGAGVFVQQGEGWTPVTLADGLPAATITAIAATDSAVWLGGASGGLVAFDR